MNKLLDTKRAGYFPWNVETVEAINSNARYIEAIMDGFNIGGRQAIILSDNIMYIKDMGWTLGKIVSVSTNINSAPNRTTLLNSPNIYSLIDSSTKISINKINSNTEVYPDVILQEGCEIVLADNDNPGWTFFEMADFFEEKWTTLQNSSISVQAGLTLNNLSLVKYNLKQRQIAVSISAYHSPFGDMERKTISFRFYTGSFHYAKQTSLSAVTMSGIGNYMIPVAARCEIGNNVANYVTVTIYLMYNDINSSLINTTNTEITGLIIY